MKKKAIFWDDDDRRHFLRLLARAVERFEWLCYSYCLMDNHFHLVIETPVENISRGMKQLNGVFTQYFNWRHKRVGHLFQGRFSAILIEKESHFLEVCRYVPNNPVRAGMCRAAGDYQWSSFRATAGFEPPPAFLRWEEVLRAFGEDLNMARQRYIQFVDAGRDARPFDQVRGQIYLGSDEFIEKLQDFGRKKKGVAPKHTRALRPPLERVLQQEDGVRVAHEEFGYSQAEIARAKGVHQATVSRLLQRRPVIQVHETRT